jgi:hypothetical protein
LHSQPLATCFANNTPPINRLPPQAEFDAAVGLGFQASTNWQQGSLTPDESAVGGAPMSTVRACSWAFRVRPLVGWGGGKATAGWLSVLSVFEPHYQARRRRRARLAPPPPRRRGAAPRLGSWGA